MSTQQRKYGENNRKQNTKKNIPPGLSKETFELSTFEKLMLYLTKTHPEYMKSDFTEAIYAYRQEQQTLAGLSLSQIEEGVLNIVRNKYPSKQIDIDTTPNQHSFDDQIEQSVASALWSTFKRYREREQSLKKSKDNNHTTAVEDQCLICLEDLHLKNTETFPCNHTFHRVCLEEWFKIERTCPLCQLTEANADRRRRQATGDSNRIQGGLSRNPDGSVSSKNMQFNPANNLNSIVSSNSLNNQQAQQSNNNLLPTSQGQRQPIRGRGFYSSPDFKPPSFEGNKPSGWFDTKYQYWVSNQNGQSDKSNMIDGKNAPPSSLQSMGNLPRREDGGAFFLQKVAKQYASRGEKAFNIDQLSAQQRRGSMCTNFQNFNGYTFGKFPCPLPPGSGMNQLDQYCCGQSNYQYCCNAQEFNQEQSGGYGNNVFNDRQRHSKTLHYSPATKRTVSVVVPIACVLAVAGALIIVFLYYKKLRNEQTRDDKPSDTYSAVPRDPPVDVERPIPVPREEQRTTVES
ncbi:hypothetical protein I4U23_026664 [Adineta vaga]|nr:hypothetical protein I4U23_026664 [Adineta vaga]